ncbi:MAG: HAD-IA family hydrolase [Granulosicoccaceae bacterium]
MKQSQAEASRLCARQLRGLIFDVDGTLAETEEVHRHCFNAVFEAAGLPDHWDQQLYAQLLHVTGGKERMRSYFERSTPPLDKDTIASFHTRKNACYARRLEDTPPALRPGIKTLIESAKAQGIKLGIATTTSRSNLAALMNSHFGTRWRDDFCAVVCGEMVQRKKPHPEAYVMALQQMQLTAQDTLAFEDSQPGVDSAKEAGLTVIATPSLYFKSSDFSRADLCIDHLELFPSDKTPALGIPQLADWFKGLQNAHA